MFDIVMDDRIEAILVSILCGAIVGVEREYKNKSAGFRTVILICFGSTIFTMASKMGDLSDDRIAANIVTGIGFLGAGVIYQGKFSVQGLTTAAVIWTMSAIGMLVGFGQSLIGIYLAITMVVILSVFQMIENIMSNIYLTKTIHVSFYDTNLQHIHDFQQFMDQHHISYSRKGISKDNERITTVYEVTGNKKKIRFLNEQIIGLKSVHSFTNM